MSKLINNSIEEQVEDIAKKQLSKVKYYTKTEAINSEIEIHRNRKSIKNSST